MPELFPVVLLMGTIALGIGAFPYAGPLNLTVATDRDSCPDLAILVEGVENSLDKTARKVASSRGLDPIRPPVLCVAHLAVPPSSPSNSGTSCGSMSGSTRCSSQVSSCDVEAPGRSETSGPRVSSSMNRESQ
ncbi:MAG: DUF1298 domain-containing protein [Gammaproteobacteria bacterium]|nr:DUF1298 domain-containing protein [Gammaproteobacteria bacterium]